MRFDIVVRSDLTQDQKLKLKELLEEAGADACPKVPHPCSVEVNLFPEADSRASTLFGTYRFGPHNQAQANLIRDEVANGLFNYFGGQVTVTLAAHDQCLHLKPDAVRKRA
jgi:hypothetical protein